jgi:Predicted transcriptional regulators
MDDSEKSLELLGSKIRKLRQEKGLSQEEFAHIADIDRSYIGQIERGERNIAFSNILKIAQALGVKISDLTEGID